MIFKRFRLIDLAIMALLVAILAGIAVRLRHPDRVAAALTDLSRREERLVEVAVPPPWRQEPLSLLPVQGDAMLGESGRDRAVFEAIRPDSTYPIAVFRVTARIDLEDRLWFNYRELLPGANFSFHTPRYTIDGLVLAVRRPDAEGG
jgi:hypothetical protein